MIHFYLKDIIINREFRIYGSLVLLLLGLLTSCSHKEQTQVLFEELEADYTGLDFENTLTYTNEFNIYKYRNYYNGGGVGLGDVNNDGLIDIYLVANLLPNRLYVNKGDFQFEDVSEKAGISGKRAWSTGVSMVDINADGWLDIYVCNSGDVEGDDRKNEFFINNKDGTFTEQAESMGLADPGFSTHAAFFDYDKDGDLDVYLLNNSYRAIGSFSMKDNERPIRDYLGGDRLFRNDEEQFFDVSEEAGIYGSVIGFGLGVAISDLDKDGWLDLYVSNDFFEKDYIYMNNQDGTFREELEKQMRSISLASMGSDIADMNNDGYADIFVTEMLPEGEERFKTTMTFENWDKYKYNQMHGYYYQFTRNMLHRHNGIIPGRGITFSEVGRYAGIEATDWSWSPLLTDLDNDGHKDIFIANGLAQDILNQDYLQYVAREDVVRMIVKDEGVDYNQLISIIPVSKISNYAFTGGKDFNFINKASEWGLGNPSHSNGAAYGDLDNDGDLDLIVNNVNMPLFVYRNTSNLKTGQVNFLKIKLNGENKNTMAIGSKITLKANGQTFYQELNPTRGFQSSVDIRLNFGLGDITIIDTLVVDWYYGKNTILTNVNANQALVLNENEATYRVEKKIRDEYNPIFTEVTSTFAEYVHKENEFVDFHRDQLLFHMKSTEGPKICLGDVNGDGKRDFFIGGAKGTAGKLFVQTTTGKFKTTSTAIFDKDKDGEDIDCVFIDADLDGDQDLYVTSGGNESSVNSFSLTDRLYINDGTGIMHRSQQILPAGIPESTSTVKADDFDSDGDLDLFVGVRLRSGLFGVPQNGYLLQNDGEGQFENMTHDVAPELLKIGMITDAVWSDYDQDGDHDLIIVGEWMKIKLFKNDNGKFSEVKSPTGLEFTSGWWNTIEAADLDADGDMDYVVGNHGSNSRFRASVDKPVSCYINDFDQNGIVEQIICTYKGDTSYPLVLRHDFVMQMPSLKSKYEKYESFKGLTINDIFTQEQLERSIIYHANLLESVIIINNGNGTFEVRKLPFEAQLSPVYAILIEDLDQDGIKDILLGGNLFEVKPEVGRYDASYGVFLKGEGNGNYKSLPGSKTGLILDGAIRDFSLIEISGENYLAVARNNASLQFYSIHHQK